MAGGSRGSGKWQQIGDEKFKVRKGGGLDFGSWRNQPTWKLEFRPARAYVGLRFLIIRVNRKDKRPANTTFPSGYRREWGVFVVCGRSAIISSLLTPKCKITEACILDHSVSSL